MLVRCSQCHRRNRVEVPLRLGGKYLCSHCKTPLSLPHDTSGGDIRAGTPTAGKPLSKRQRTFLVILVTLNCVYLFVLGITTFFDVIGPEQWWLTGFLQFMPRWPLIAPALLLLMPMLWGSRLPGSRRAHLWLSILPTLALVWVLGPLMGLCVHMPPHGYDSTNEIKMRVLTYNVKWGARDSREIAEEIVREQPDLIQFQDSAGILSKDVGRVLTPEQGWTVRQSGQYLVASRWHLSPLEDIDISFPGSLHHAVRATLTPPTGQKPITIYNAHLLSPRMGLLSVRGRNIAGLQGNFQHRQFEAERLAEVMLASIANRGEAVLLTGDLNAAPTSQVITTFEHTGLRDAYTTAGLGYGYTYGATTKARYPYVRIDHIMASEQFRVGAVRVGNDRGSDHCPVIADLYLSRH